MRFGRFIQRIPPLWLGIAISTSLLLLLFAIETFLGRWSAMLVDGEFDPLAKVSTGELRDIRIAVVHCLIVGYLPAAFLYVLRNGQRTVRVLQGALDCTSEECERLAASVRLSTTVIIITGLCGFALALATPYLIPPVPLHPWDPSTWGPEVTWHRILGPVAMVWAWWLVYAIISVSLRMSRIAKRLHNIDLLDLSNLAPFTQLGLSNALLLIGSLSIWSLMMIETGFGRMMLIFGVIILAETALALLAPVLGAHKRICQSKETALDWVNAAISKQQATFQNATSNHDNGRMADLVTYRGMIENVSEWPFTLSTFARLALYLLIPFFTWVIGIFAENVIGHIFL